MKPKTVGYIVWFDDNCGLAFPFSLVKAPLAEVHILDDPSEAPPTMFETRGHAHAAIKRTRAYYKMIDAKSMVDTFHPIFIKVRPVVAAPETPHEL